MLCALWRHHKWSAAEAAIIATHPRYSAALLDALAEHLCYMWIAHRAYHSAAAAAALCPEQLTACTAARCERASVNGQ
jgi:hypothetical protein